MASDLPRPAVRVYTVKGCPRCAAVMRHLAERGVEFEEVDVRADGKRRAREMIEKSGQKTVPVTEIGGRIVIGVKPDEIEEALRREQYH